MKAFIQKERIRVVPVPKDDTWRIWVWLKKPLSEGAEPRVYADTNKGQKFYDLPCNLDNIDVVVIKPK